MSQSEFMGRMNDPSSAARVTGPCGDTMEFYLVITDDHIEQIRYYTDGCKYTNICAETAARKVQGKSLYEALNLSAADILKALPDLPKTNHHCAILSVSTLYRAIGEFWILQARS